MIRGGRLRLGNVTILHRIVGGIVFACSLFPLASCMPSSNGTGKNSGVEMPDAVGSIDLRARSPRVQPNTSIGPADVAGQSYYGTATTPASDVQDRPIVDTKDGLNINFENTPVASVAKVILGDVLGVSYVVDPRVQGTISVSSGRPVAKKDLLFVLENALHAVNIAMVRDKGGYSIVPSNGALVGGVDHEGSNATAEPGYGITVVPVAYVSAPTIAKMLEGFAIRPGAIRTDPSGNLLVIVGSGAERQTAVDTIRNFDVDWLKGQSVGIYPVHNSAPEPVVAELENIMDTGDSGLGHNLVKFQVVSRENAIMVVAAKPELLKTAETWVRRLDQSATASTGVKVYKVKYGDAKQIAALLSNMFASNSSNGGLDSAFNQIAPSSGASVLTALDRLSGNGGSATQSTPGTAVQPASMGSASGLHNSAVSTFGGLAPVASNSPSASHAVANGSSDLPGVRITADAANNSILIYSDQQNYRVIEQALNQLDRPKLQVAINVTIAEVTLNDDLNYGVQVFLSNKFGSLLNTASTSTTSGGTPSSSPITETLPGFNLVVGNQMTPRLILNALHQYTSVKVLSNPSLVVVDNQPATLEVGDQVPVTTGSATVLSANNTVVSTVDYKNTGIILNVLPRVNSNGNVLLDIEQEISSVPAGSSLTPTISERKVRSTLSVASGQTVLLAGLISETQNNTRSGVPILDSLPFVGGAFGSTDKSAVRTELIMFIRPQIIRDGADASAVAEELRNKMRGTSSKRFPNASESALDVK